MYEFLEGTLDTRMPARLALNVGGVGYDIAVPIGSSFGHDTDKGATLRVWTHLVVREDSHTLYGFPDREMRELFRLFLSVRGIGPGIALGILSGLSREELIRAILDDDVKRLCQLKGVGKKTAEQILLDLRDKAPAWQSAMDTPIAAKKSGAREPDTETLIEDAIQALMSIGYSAKDARKSVEKVADKNPTPDLELLVREALRS